MNLYETLNVEREASSLEIEKSYKRIILEVHPNRNNSNLNKYLEINSAYEILKDKYKRDFYDIFGDNSVKILQNGKEGFILSRCFNKINLYICFLLFMISLSNIMILPLYVYLYSNSENKSFTFYIIPFFISSVLLLLPVYRAYRLINRLVLQLFNMLSAAINIIITSSEVLCLCLYADSKINQTISILLLASLETSSVLFKLYRNKKIEDYQGKQNPTDTFSDYKIPKDFTEYIKKYIPHGVWYISLIISVIDIIPIYIRVPIPFAGILFYIYSADIAFILKNILATPIILYSITFCLVIFRVRSIFLFIPLFLLSICIFIAFFYLYRKLPHLKFTHKKITHEDLYKV